jgi:hypothetical protein
MRTYRRRIDCTKAISILDACPCITRPQMRLGLAGCMMYEKTQPNRSLVMLLGSVGWAAVLAVILLVLLLLLLVQGAACWLLIQLGPEGFSLTQQVIAPILDLGQLNLLGNP